MAKTSAVRLSTGETFPTPFSSVSVFDGLTQEYYVDEDGNYHLSDKAVLISGKTRAIRMQDGATRFGKVG